MIELLGRLTALAVVVTIGAIFGLRGLAVTVLLCLVFLPIIERLNRPEPRP